MPPKPSAASCLSSQTFAVSPAPDAIDSACSAIQAGVFSSDGVWARSRARCTAPTVAAAASSGAPAAASRSTTKVRRSSGFGFATLRRENEYAASAAASANARRPSLSAASTAVVAIARPFPARLATAALALRSAAGVPSPTPTSSTVLTPSRATGTSTTSPALPVASLAASRAAASTPRPASTSSPRPTDAEGSPGTTGTASTSPAPVSGPALASSSIALTRLLHRLERPSPNMRTPDMRQPQRSGSAGADQWGGKRSADSTLQRVTERGRLVRRQFDDEPATALERHPHHDAPPLLGDLEWAVTGPRLHRRHAEPLSLQPPAYRGAHCWSVLSITTRPRPATYGAVCAKGPLACQRPLSVRGWDAGSLGAVRPVRRPPAHAWRPGARRRPRPAARLPRHRRSGGAHRGVADGAAGLAGAGQHRSGPGLPAHRAGLAAPGRGGGSDLPAAPAGSLGRPLVDCAAGAHAQPHYPRARAAGAGVPRLPAGTPRWLDRPAPGAGAGVGDGRRGRRGHPFPRRARRGGRGSGGAVVGSARARCGVPSLARRRSAAGRNGRPGPGRAHLVRRTQHLAARVA